MTTAAIPLTTGFGFTPWVGRGLSEEARSLDRLSCEATEFSGSITFGERKRTAQAALSLAYETAQVEDWDGEGPRAAGLLLQIRR